MFGLKLSKIKIDGRPIDRKLAQELALERGLVIKSGVSKKLDILVAANLYTQSSKANKARDLEIEIVAEPVFWQMLGIKVE